MRAGLTPQFCRLQAIKNRSHVGSERGYNSYIHCGDHHHARDHHRVRLPRGGHHRVRLPRGDSVLVLYHR